MTMLTHLVLWKLSNPHDSLDPIAGESEQREEGGEGSLTSLAKQVFLPHIEMQVLNAQFAFLEVNLLVVAIAGIINRAFPLLGRVVGHGDVELGGTPVDAVCRSGKRGSRSRDRGRDRD